MWKRLLELNLYPLQSPKGFFLTGSTVLSTSSSHEQCGFVMKKGIPESLKETNTLGMGHSLESMCFVKEEPLTAVMR